MAWPWLWAEGQGEGGSQIPHPGWHPPLQGSTWGDARTSLGDALLHLGAQLREEHVLSWILCRVIEENLKERKKSLKNSSSPVILWHHTGLTTSKGSPAHPGVTPSKGLYALLTVASRLWDGENCFCSAFCSPGAWQTLPGGHCPLPLGVTADSQMSLFPASPHQRQPGPRGSASQAECGCWLVFKARSFCHFRPVNYCLSTASC